MCNSLTIREIVAQLEVTSETLHRWRKGLPGREPLPHHIDVHGAGRKVTILADDLERYLRRHRPDLLERWQFCCRDTAA